MLSYEVIENIYDDFLSIADQTRMTDPVLVTGMYSFSPANSNRSCDVKAAKENLDSIEKLKIETHVYSAADLDLAFQNPKYLPLNQLDVDREYARYYLALVICNARQREFNNTLTAFSIPQRQQEWSSLSDAVCLQYDPLYKPLYDQWEAARTKYRQTQPSWLSMKVILDPKTRRRISDSMPRTDGKVVMGIAYAAAFENIITNPALIAVKASEANAPQKAKIDPKAFALEQTKKVQIAGSEDPSFSGVHSKMEVSDAQAQAEAKALREKFKQLQGINVSIVNNNVVQTGGEEQNTEIKKRLKTINNFLYYYGITEPNYKILIDPKRKAEHRKIIEEARSTDEKFIFDAYGKPHKITEYKYRLREDMALLDKFIQNPQDPSLGLNTDLLNFLAEKYKITQASVSRNQNVASAVAVNPSIAASVASPSLNAGNAGLASPQNQKSGAEASVVTPSRANLASGAVTPTPTPSVTPAATPNLSAAVRNPISAAPLVSLAAITPPLPTVNRTPNVPATPATVPTVSRPPNVPVSPATIPAVNRAPNIPATPTASAVTPTPSVTPAATPQSANPPIITIRPPNSTPTPTPSAVAQTPAANAAANRAPANPLAAQPVVNRAPQQPAANPNAAAVNPPAVANTQPPAQPTKPTSTGRRKIL